MDELTREFLIESQEGLDRMERCLTDLEERPQDAALIGEIFRSVHTIKGTTGFLGFKRLETLAHAGENLLGLLREGKLTANGPIVTGLLELLDGLRAILKTIEAQDAEGDGDDAALIGRLVELQLPAQAEAKRAVSAKARAVSAAVRSQARAAVSDPVPTGADLVASAPSTVQPPEQAPATPPALKAAVVTENDAAKPRAQGTAAESTLRVDVTLLNRMMNLVGELVLTRNQVLQATSTKVLRNQGMARLEELVQHLKVRKNPILERSIAEAMTINETSFFRDGRPFELLRTELLPALIEARRLSRGLRFWSAACSTGQEAYSLAMLLHEHFPQLAGWNIRIEGTDICAEVVERAQAGCYHRIEINRGLPARFVVRYFDHVGEDWTVKPEIRRICNFRQANLCLPTLPFNRADDRFDVIFLRNVMLYFSQETRKTLLAGIHKLLAPDGLLFLGSSEQPAEASIWTPVLAGGTCHFRLRQPS